MRTQEDVTEVQHVPVELVDTTAHYTTYNTDHAAAQVQHAPVELVDTTATTSSSSSSRPIPTRDVYAVVYFGVCFCTLFCAFGVAQIYITSLFGSVGFLSLALLYGTFGVASLFGPSMLKFTGLRTSFVLSSLTYGGYVLAAALDSKATLLAMSVVIGIGAALLWVAQGAYLSRIAESCGNQGKLNGVFFSVLNLSGIVGYTLAGTIVESGLDATSMLWVLFGVSLVASTMFVCVQSRKTSKPEVRVDLFRRAKKVIETLEVPNMRLLYLYAASQSMNESFTVSVVPKMMYEEQIPWVFLVWACLAVTTAFILGKLMDRSWKYVVYTHVVVTHSAMALILYQYYHYNVNTNEKTETDTRLFAPLLVFFIIAGLLGISYSSSNVCISSTIIRLYPFDNTSYFAMYRMIGSVAQMVGFILGLFLPVQAHIGIILASQVTAVVGYHYIQERKEVLTQESTTVATTTVYSNLEPMTVPTPSPTTEQ